MRERARVRESVCGAYVYIQESLMRDFRARLNWQYWAQPQPKRDAVT